MRDKEGAQVHGAHFVECYPNVKPELVREIFLCKNQADADRRLEGLDKAGINE